MIAAWLRWVRDPNQKGRMGKKEYSLETSKKIEEEDKDLHTDVERDGCRYIRKWTAKARPTEMTPSLQESDLIQAEIIWKRHEQLHRIAFERQRTLKPERHQKLIEHRRQSYAAAQKSKAAKADSKENVQAITYTCQTWLQTIRNWIPDTAHSAKSCPFHTNSPASDDFQTHTIPGSTCIRLWSIHLHPDRLLFETPDERQAACRHFKEHIVHWKRSKAVVTKSVLTSALESNRPVVKRARPSDFQHLRRKRARVHSPTELASKSKKELILDQNEITLKFRRLDDVLQLAEQIPELDVSKAVRVKYRSNCCPAKYAETWDGMPDANLYYDRENYRLKASSHVQQILELLLVPGSSYNRGMGSKRFSLKYWYPPPLMSTHKEIYVREGKREWIQPKHPIYVISKGRHMYKRLTPHILLEQNVRCQVVVEPQEFELYAQILPRDCLLQLPFADLGQGSIPARNWVWEHAKASGSEWHWILDDNIRNFNRFHDNKIRSCRCTGALFAAAETFAERCSNVAIAGFHDAKFIVPGQIVKPYYTNTRVYSCLLIRNCIPFAWRGKYNEDTDLCLRVLKAGYATVLFNAFLMEKAATMKMKGGNTDDLYANGRLEFAQSLQRQHPDVVRVGTRFQRDHHYVDYSSFRNNPLGYQQAPDAATYDYDMHIVRVAKKIQKSD